MENMPSKQSKKEKHFYFHSDKRIIDHDRIKNRNGLIKPIPNLHKNNLLPHFIYDCTIKFLLYHLFKNLC